MIRLTKSFGQYKSVSSKEVESYLCIEVGYDPIENEVTDDEVRVWAWEPKTGKVIDLTAIFNESLSETLETMISSIDWRECYREQRKSKAA